MNTESVPPTQPQENFTEFTNTGMPNSSTYNQPNASFGMGSNPSGGYNQNNPGSSQQNFFSGQGGMPGGFNPSMFNIPDLIPFEKNPFKTIEEYQQYYSK